MRQRTSLHVALGAFLAAAFSSATVGQQAPAARQGGPPPLQLPAGDGREQVQAMCTSCHGLNLIANSWGYTKDGWEDRIATMAKLPVAEWTQIGISSRPASS